MGQLLVTFEQLNGVKFEYPSCPDTGSSIKIISYNIAKRNNVNFYRNTGSKLRNASGKQMQIEGIAEINSRPSYINGRYNQNRRIVKSRYVITRDMQNEILFPKEDLKRFGVIPKNLPNVEVNEETKATKEEIKIHSNKIDRLWHRYSL